MTWKVEDWAIFDREIVQIKEIREGGCCSVSDGAIESSGMLFDRLRPLTLRNKRIAEEFKWHYNELHKIRGEGGFNYPDISQHFSDLCLLAIDDGDDSEAFDNVLEFVQKARDYVPEIQGVQLFRAAARG